MDYPIRVLHVVVNMNRGGAETLLMNLYRNIDRSKVQFDFLTCKPGVFDEEIQDLGGKIHRIPYISDVGHFRYRKELNIFFEENKHYAIVHSHMDKMSGFVLHAAKKAGIPTRISHSHNTQSEGGLVTKLYKWYAGQYIFPNATNFFACSSEAANWLFPRKAEMALILKNGIEHEQFAYSDEVRKNIREELLIDDQTFVLGHVGRFNLQKNHSYLLDIFSNYHSINSKSKLILVGDGPLRNEIEQKAKNLGIEKDVLFLGVRSDINCLLQAFDVFVFPSLHEGLPVSLIEAQGAGVPCVISDVISKEVDLEINLVEYAPLHNLQDWINKIKRVASKSNSRYLQKDALSVKGYDIKKTAIEVENFYSKVSGEG